MTTEGSFKDDGVSTNNYTEFLVPTVPRGLSSVPMRRKLVSTLNTEFPLEVVMVRNKSLRRPME